MALLKIARMGHPILSRVADHVPDPTDSAIIVLAEDMAETMLDAPGVGLAAPQVHVPLRVVTYYVPEERTGEGEAPQGLTALINPELTPLGNETDIAREACLSLPGMSGLVERYTHIGLKAQDLKGNTIEKEVSGYHARVLQHECDHLDGVLYPMRMDDLSSFGYSEEMVKPDPEQAGNDNE